MGANQLEKFLALSARLTGFDIIDLQAKGVGQAYLDALIQGAGTDNVQDLLNKASQLRDDDEDLLKNHIWKHEKDGPLARNIVLMWYLGSWLPLPVEWHKKHKQPRVKEYVISVDTYLQALQWDVIGAHPPGAMPGGFGSWSDPPKVDEAQPSKEVQHD